MDSSRWEASGTPDEAQEGLTRREALRRGTLAGIGLVWATPQVASYRMTAQLAQATSPVAGTTIPGTTEPPEKTTDPKDPKEPKEPKEPTGSTEPTDEVSPTTISRDPTTVDKGPSAEATQPRTERGSSEEIKDEVLSSELPFTGLPLEQLLPLAGGAVATGAAAVRLARERSERSAVEDEESPE